MRRKAFLLGVLALGAAAPAAVAAVASVRTDLAREILRRVPQWPGTDVEIPVSLYEAYVRELAEGPTPPQPPVVTWTERARYGLRIDAKEATLVAAFEVVRLPGKGGTSVALLPADFAWRDVTVDGRKAELRRADDGWHHFDAPAPGRYRVVATAVLEPKQTGDVRRIVFATPPAGWTSAAVDSDGAWAARFSRSPLAIQGAGAGTHGAVGLAAGDRLAITWQPPQPPVHRAAQIATEAHVGWTLADGVQQVRAVLHLRLWGGETSELAVNLPPGADRVRITGPDVREVRTAGATARVFLRGAIRQRSRLNVEFEAPRPATGRMTLPAFGVEGSSHQGGTLAVAGGAGGVLLEMDSPGLAPMALYDLPRETRGLLAAPPVYAYRVTGPWEARVDLVSMSEFPVRETLIDSALYTVLYRPDGRIMTKVIYEVRNRALQYMAVDLPPDAELVVARVSEVQKNLARGPGRTVYVPLEKSVLTTAGLVSFPVELVYVMRGEGLLRSGTFRLPLPRAGLPVAYARCALMLPDGMRVGDWRGVLRRTDAWSSETAELEFEYGRGHLAEGLRPRADTPPEAPPPAREPEKPKALGLFNAIGRLFVRAETVPGAKRLKQHKMERMGEQEPTRGDEFDEKPRAQARILQGKNLFRAGTDYYRRGDYAKAADLFKNTIAAAPESLEANKARQYLGNVAVALGKEEGGKTKERGLRATAKAVRKAQQGGNVEIRERQKQLLAQAERAVRQGNRDQADAAYQVAVNLGKQLQARGEEAHEQEAIVRKAQSYLAARAQARKHEDKRVAELQQQLQSLQEDLAKKGGRDLQQVVKALVLTDAPGLGAPTQAEDGALRGPMPGLTSARSTPQVELGEALAEQQVTQQGGGGRRIIGTGGIGGGVAGYAYGGTYTPQTVERLKKQVEQLKSLQDQLATAAPTAGADRAGTLETNGAAKAARPEAGVRRGTFADEEAAAGEAERSAFRPGDFGTTQPSREGLTHGAALNLGRQVAEKAQDLKAEARKAAELARQGRLDEAGKLIKRLEKRAQVTAGAAEALARRGGTYRAESAVPFEVPPGRRPKPPVGGPAAATPPPARGVPSRSRKPPTATAATRPAPVPETPPVRRVEGGAGVASYLRYPDAKDWKALKEQRREFARAVPARPSRAGETTVRRAEPDFAPPGAAARRHVTRAARPGAAKPSLGHVTSRKETDPWRDVRDALEDVTKARKTLEREARRKDKVRFNVKDLTAGADNGRDLASFVARNYAWAFSGKPSGGDVSGVVLHNGQAVTTETVPKRTVGLTMAGGTAVFESDDDGDKAGLRFDTGGTLVVDNRPNAVRGVRKVLERLRVNLGQRVGVASRNFWVEASAAEAAGIRWKTGANGVRYAVVNDGQIRGIMDVEQRGAGAAVSGPLPPRDAYQEAVVGTDALVANGVRVAVSGAGDQRNTLTYDGNTVQVAHDDYLLVDNGGYLTAVKSGRMQHWSVEVAPVRFPGVPAAVSVPTVGYTVKFEKTLLDASDKVELVADYTWEGEE